MTLLGIDVFGGNSATTVTADINKPDVNFVIAKATEGQRTTDSRHALIRAEVEAAGKPFGSYHFAWPNQNPITEADNFLATAKPKPGEIMCLDLEDWGTGAKPTPEMTATSWAARVTYALAWLARVQSATGTKPFVYANVSWRDSLKAAATPAQWAVLKTFPLWLANYRIPAVPGQPTSNITDWPMVIHQYTDTLGGASRDGDWFAGNYNQLLAYAIPKTPEVTMSQAQYDALMGKLSELSGTTAVLRDSVSSVSNGLAAAQADIKGINSTVGNVLAYVNDLPDEHTAMRENLAAIQASIAGLATPDLSADIHAAVKDSLGGFQITTTTKFPE